MSKHIWTPEDQAISDSKQYFVVTTYSPKGKREIKHLWGPGTGAQARRVKDRILRENANDPRAADGQFTVETVRWRGGFNLV